MEKKFIFVVFQQPFPLHLAEDGAHGAALYRQIIRQPLPVKGNDKAVTLLAAGLSGTPVTLAAKSLLRVGCPVVVAVSTNDGLGASGENIARLLNRKHYYFVPFAQDDWVHKPQSLKADLDRLPQTLDAALEGRQIQPVIL